jgi:hydroxyacylglutathione hydrolase
MVTVTDSIFLIPGQDDMIPDSHTYLIGKPGSRDLSLVDPGLMGKGSYKLTAIEDAGIDVHDIRRIILTHTHLDHIGCVTQIMNRIPEIELWVHVEEAAQLEAGDERTVYGMEMFRQMCQSQYRLKDGAFKLKVHRALTDGEELGIGGANWRVLHVPGHSPGGIALYEPTESILIPGDVIYADYAIGRFDLHGADRTRLGASLARLAGLNVTVLLPGHNNIVRPVPPKYVANVAKQWGPYLS